MARPRKPAGLKLISGTTRRDRPPPAPVKADPLTAVPEPPVWLNVAARAEWRRMAGVLVAARVLTPAALAQLAHLAALNERIARAFGEDLLPPAGALREARLLAGAFGLTPASKVAQQPAPSGGNAFSGRGVRD